MAEASERLFEIGEKFLVGRMRRKPGDSERVVESYLATVTEILPDDRLVITIDARVEDDEAPSSSRLRARWPGGRRSAWWARR